MKEKLKAWFLENEDRLEDLSDLEAVAQFGQIGLDEFQKLKEEIIIEMVMENLNEMPDLNFHAQKNLFPYPNSMQLQGARERLGLGPAKMKH